MYFIVQTLAKVSIPKEKKKKEKNTRTDLQNAHKWVRNVSVASGNCGSDLCVVCPIRIVQPAVGTDGSEYGVPFSQEFAVACLSGYIRSSIHTNTHTYISQNARTFMGVAVKIEGKVNCAVWMTGNLWCSVWNSWSVLLCGECWLNREQMPLTSASFFGWIRCYKELQPYWDQDSKKHTWSWQRQTPRIWGRSCRGPPGTLQC